MDFQKLGQRAAETGADFTKPTAGGDFKPLAEGPCRLRLVGYIEVGKQKGTYQGQPKISEKAWLTFEVSGPKHPPREHEGEKFPNLITVKETKSLSAKANLIKLFTRMNHDGKAQHIIQLVGNAFKGRIVHRKYAKKGEPKDDPSKWTGISVELRDKNGYTIEPPFYEKVNPDDHEEPGPTGEMLPLTVAAPLSPLRGFLWSDPDMEQWASIFIDGKYDDQKDEKTGDVRPGKSKNIIQAAIMGAENFKGSPIHTLLLAGGTPLDIPDVDNAQDDDDDAPGEAPASPAKSTVVIPEGEAADDALNAAMWA